MKQLSQYQNNPINPRSITRAAMDRLKASIELEPEFMQLRPIIVDADNIILCGNQRFTACQELGLEEVQDSWVIEAGELSDEKRRRLVLIDNTPDGLGGDWDIDELLKSFADLDLGALGFDLEAMGSEIISSGEEGDAEPQEDKAAELQELWQTEAGQLWSIGEHRLLCGDSTKAEDVGRLMDGEKADLIHADPPYGMGKENEGVENDNLYRDKLDDFQMQWWTAFRPFTVDNGSVYIWGNAEDLWRLWYKGGLKDSERLTFRSQVIWDKPPSASPSGSPIGSEKMRSYPHGYEVCLFFMLGEQGFNNNADNYWEGWEPIRGYLEQEMNKVGGVKQWKNALDNQMGSHYFTKSQWLFPTEEAYMKLQSFAEGVAFKRDYDDLKRDYDDLKREFYATRAYFDNTHDNMTDVWEFGRVTGEDRHGHATPKPVEMIQRCIKSSSTEGAIITEPFLGSGSTMVAAQNLNRKCYGLEISPAYCAVILQRMKDAFPGIEINKING